jgi:hypothetical protein
VAAGLTDVFGQAQLEETLVLLAPETWEWAVLISLMSLGALSHTYVYIYTHVKVCVCVCACVCLYEARIFEF